MHSLENGMILYHGSYCPVEKPDLQKCALFKDFGRGFYLTTSLKQAQSFAKISATKAKSRGIISDGGKNAYVSTFTVTDTGGLQSFSFENADVNWLHCVVAHRKDDTFPDIRKAMQNYDIISGKIANDNTNATILAYIGNVFGPVGSEQADRMCISLLVPERLKDQFCFRSDQALTRLSFVESTMVFPD